VPPYAARATRGARPLPSSHVDAHDLATLATAVAAEAGALLLGYAERLAQGDHLDTVTKSSPTDLASEADHAAEALLAGRLLEARPDDGLLGEEDAADRPGTSGLTWVVDPLDGTTNFLRGVPVWSVSVACVDGSGPVAGVVHDPTRGESFVAWRGGGAHLGDRQLRCTEVEDAGLALVATGFAYDAARRAGWGRTVAALLAEVRDVRRAGSAALDLAWCAAGRVDGYVELGLHAWDWAAGSLLVEEAGGVTSSVDHDLAGTSVTGLVAGGRRVHDHLVDFLDRTT
jgi:myo-inositol-1(or 4)-monophosphatase